MQIGGFGSPAAIWLNSLGKTGDLQPREPFPTDKTGQKEPAKAAASNTSFPTAPPLALGADALLALQQADGAAGAGPAQPGADEEMTDLDSTAEDQFLDYMQKSPAERLRDKILKALGVTEDDIKNMTMDERMALEKKIADIIKETLVKPNAPGAAEGDHVSQEAVQQVFPSLVA